MTGSKFTILLPTRDRLDLAKDAIATIRRQTYPHWELIVADNCSAEDVGSYVASLSDPRIIYIRSDTPLPVTENWNRALDASSGDCIIMLGDDDGLTPGYFERLIEANETLNYPDFIYHGAYHFAFPNVLPGTPKSTLTDVTLTQGFFRNQPSPSLLAREQAHALARAALNMQVQYGFNMQYFAFSRRFLTRMAKFGPFFQGPFPDFYAANMSMLKAERIGLLANPMVIIGISPKSYGYYHLNKKEKGGINLLNTTSYVDETPEWLQKKLLPGTNIYSSWLVSVALIPKHFGNPADLLPNIARYRRLQIIHNLKGAALNEPVEASLSKLWPYLNWDEKAFAFGLEIFFLPARILKGRYQRKWIRLVEACANLPSLILRWRLRRKWIRFADFFANHILALPLNRSAPVIGRYKSILEVFEGLREQSSLPTSKALHKVAI